MPLAGSPRLGSTCSAVGMAGPAPSDATYAASWLICSCVELDRLDLRLRAAHLRRHATGADLEVDRRGAHADERRGARRCRRAEGPWHVAQLAWNSFSPVAMSLALAFTGVASADVGASTAYRPPVSSSASRSSTIGARRSCLRAASAFTDRSSSRTWGMWASERRAAAPAAPYFKQVDHGEERDPHDVDEVPVVRRDDAGGGLVVTEPLGGERATEQEEEGDQTADDVQAVEARWSGRRPSRTGSTRSSDPRCTRLGVLEDLAADEEGAHEVRERHPLVHAPAVAPGGASRCGPAGTARRPRRPSGTSPTTAPAPWC